MEGLEVKFFSNNQSGLDIRYKNQHYRLKQTGKVIKVILVVLLLCGSKVDCSLLVDPPEVVYCLIKHRDERCEKDDNYFNTKVFINETKISIYSVKRFFQVKHGFIRKLL